MLFALHKSLHSFFVIVIAGWFGATASNSLPANMRSPSAPAISNLKIAAPITYRINGGSFAPALQTPELDAAQRGKKRYQE
jgi:hypothetical protein